MTRGVGRPTTPRSSGGITAGRLAGALAALHRRLELAEAAGDRAAAATLHARWLDLERRRLAARRHGSLALGGGRGPA